MNGDILCLVGTIPRRRYRNRPLFRVGVLLSPPTILASLFPPQTHQALQLRLFFFPSQFRFRHCHPLLERRRRRRRNAGDKSRSDSDTFSGTGTGGFGRSAHGFVDDGGTGSGDYDSRAQLFGLSEFVSPFNDQFVDAKGCQ